MWILFWPGCLMDSMLDIAMLSFVFSVPWMQKYLFLDLHFTTCKHPGKTCGSEYTFSYQMISWNNFKWQWEKAFSFFFGFPWWLASSFPSSQWRGELRFLLSHLILFRKGSFGDLLQTLSEDAGSLHEHLSNKPGNKIMCSFWRMFIQCTLKVCGTKNCVPRHSVISCNKWTQAREWSYVVLKEMTAKLN